ncbi:aldo/keto reductase family oxidoreductase [Streptomyces sp. NPDC058308]|uniref:aldo/keto reductase n=1 Tax=Streptomyces sp. NPDC058308 TaxID=3346440 RepID=UPI0036ECE618
MTAQLDMPAGQPLYGCMGLGGTWDTVPYTASDIAHAEAAVEAALAIGITAFDHADIYRRGKAEAVFGELLARAPDLRSRIVLQTKCGIRQAEDGLPGMYDLRGPSIVRRVEESLTRLRTDVIDVLLLHRPDPLAAPAEIAEALTSLHRQGLVRRFGVSNMSAAQMDALQEHLELPLSANQLEMSLGSRDWVEAGAVLNTRDATTNGFPHGTVEYCVARGIRLQAWGPLAQGRFTGAADSPAARLVAALAERKRTTPETILLWWLQRHPAEIAPVIGTSRPERILACRDAVTREPELTHEEWYELWVTARGVPLP